MNSTNPSRFFLLAIFASTLFLGGCVSSGQFVPSTVDGKDYFGASPQVAVGTFEEVRVTEKNGAVHSFSQGASSVAGEMGGSVPILTNLGGMSNAGAGLAAAGIGFVFDIISASSAPTIEVMVRRDPEGDLINVPVDGHELKRIHDYNCVNLGDRVRVVYGSNRRFGVYNWVPKLVRVSDFQPNCRQLRAEAGLPNPPEKD